MKFRTRIILCAALPATLLVAALGTSLWGQVQTRASFDQYLANEARRADGLSEMYAQGLQMGQALRNIVLDPANRKAYENLDSARSAYDAAVADLQTLDSDAAGAAGLATLNVLRGKHATAQKDVLQLVASDPGAAAKRLNAAETPAWRKLRAQLIEQRSVARTESARRHEETNARATRATAISIGFAVLAVLVSVGFGVLTQRTLSRELGGEPADASAALRRIAQGDSRPSHAAAALETGRPAAPPQILGTLACSAAFCRPRS
jgi:CHASE3 domain sensor protein